MIALKNKIYNNMQKEAADRTRVGSSGPRPRMKSERKSSTSGAPRTNYNDMLTRHAVKNHYEPATYGYSGDKPNLSQARTRGSLNKYLANAQRLGDAVVNSKPEDKDRSIKHYLGAMKGHRRDHGEDSVAKMNDGHRRRIMYANQRASSDKAWGERVAASKKSENSSANQKKEESTPKPVLPRSEPTPKPETAQASSSGPRIMQKRKPMLEAPGSKNNKPVLPRSALPPKAEPQKIDPPKIDPPKVGTPKSEQPRSNPAPGAGSKPGLSGKQKLAIGGSVAATAGALYMANRYRKSRKAKMEKEKEGQEKTASLRKLYRVQAITNAPMTKMAEEGKISRDDARRELERRKSPMKRAIKTVGGKMLIGGGVGHNLGALSGNDFAAKMGGRIGRFGGLLNAVVTNSRAKKNGEGMSDEQLEAVYRKNASANDHGYDRAVKINDFAKKNIDKALGVENASKLAPSRSDAKKELRRRSGGVKSAMGAYAPRVMIGHLVGEKIGSAASKNSERGKDIGGSLGILAGFAHGYRSRAISKNRTKHLSDAQLERM